MPELPEVETVRRGLAPALEGARLDRLELRRADLRFPFPEGIAERLSGRTITALGRRAKYLLIHFDDASVMISHLGMSGSWRFETMSEPAEPLGQFYYPRGKDGVHDHMVMHLSRSGDAVRAVYNDPRRFGFVDLTDMAGLDTNPYLASLGIEPTGNTLDGASLAGLLAGKATPLKSALLDQRLIAGLGNIYVCEALWRAGLSPKRSAGSIVRTDGGPTPRCEALAVAIREVIASAIEAGGSSLRDHIRTDGTLGYFQHTFQAYGREGEPCLRPGCKGQIHRTVQSGRSTFHCTSCQR